MLMPAKRSRVAIAVAAAGVALLAAAASSEARVTQITITNTTSLFDGRAFGDVGAYEQIRGTATGELDPSDPHNAVITDINFAPRNANGKVAYTTSFTLHKPVDTSRSSGVMVYEVVNRGSKLLPRFTLVGMTAENPAGDGFLYRTGNIYLWSGWQGDLAFNPTSTLETIQVPVAAGVTGPIFARFVSASGSTRPLPGAGRAPANLDTAQAKFISIAHESNLGVRSGVVEIASGDWAFADCASTPFPGTPSEANICLRNGFDPALVYELVYTAKDPLVLGVGMAATRDVASFFRRASAAARQPDRRPGRACRGVRHFAVRPLPQEFHSARVQRG